MAELRFAWEADYRPAGERGSAARRRSAASIARTRAGQSPGRGLPALRGMLRAVEPVIPKVQLAAEQAVLEALVGPQSLWPVDTGYSIAGFGFVGSGRDAQLTNRAHYAGIVEGKTRAAERTLEAAADAIREAAERAAEDEL